MAYEYPSYGQAIASNELRKEGILVSSGGVRSIWLRNNLETFKKRPHLLEESSQGGDSLHRSSTCGARIGKKRAGITS